MQDATRLGFQLRERKKKAITYLPGLMFSVLLAMAATFITNVYGGPTVLFALLL